MKKYIGALDSGTTSTRFIIFDHNGKIVSFEQKEHAQLFPKPGWVEHDPIEIWQNSIAAMKGAIDKGKIPAKDICAIGITNQRETTVVWDKRSGKPFYNAVVWQCTRTADICNRVGLESDQEIIRNKTGLPISTYFSGPKIKWILENVPGAKSAADKGFALFGTIETWIIWWLTGGPNKGKHITDVTNASRTLLMNIDRLEWDHELLKIFEIPESILPDIVPSIDSQGWGITYADGVFEPPVPLCGALGDQQAALVGQSCFAQGEAKNTYGTGCFLLMNTGTSAIRSNKGLLTTPAYQIRGEKPVYCIEGSVAMAGALVQWLRDNLGLISESHEIEKLAQTVADNGGIYFVPAFSGLFAPYWRPDARGIIAGLSRYINKGHIARAALEASAYQTYDVVETIKAESGIQLKNLKVDGGMTINNLLMQFQADILDLTLMAPKVIETTALGAAYAAGLAVGYWTSIAEIETKYKAHKVWEPQMHADDRKRLIQGWEKAVRKSLGWVC